jgi:hypothetical protein
MCGQPTDPSLLGLRANGLRARGLRGRATKGGGKRGELVDVLPALDCRGCDQRGNSNAYWKYQSWLVAVCSTSVEMEGVPAPEL